MFGHADRDVIAPIYTRRSAGNVLPVLPFRVPTAQLTLDLAIAAVIGMLAGALSLALSRYIAPILYVDVDLYFGADINRVYDYMTGQGRFAQFRSNVHPVFTFLLFPPTRSFMGIGFTPEQATQILVALSAGATTVMIYAIGRLTGLSRLDAALLGALFIASGAFVFWWTVPETFAFGGMSVALAFMVALLRSTGLLAWVLTSALSLAITTTNLAAPLIAGIFRLGWTRTIQVAAISFGLVVVLSVWQRAYLPTARLFFLPGSILEELAFVQMLADVGWSVSFGGKLASFWLAPWVVPETVLTGTQGIRPVHLAYGLSGWLGLSGLLALNIAVLDTLRHRADLRALVLAPALFLAFQFVLHLVYGDEPFLYSAHFMPAFLCIAAAGFLGRMAWLCRVGVLVLVVIGGLTNVMTFMAVNNTLTALSTL